MLSRTVTRATPSRQVVRHLSRRGLGTTPPAQKPRSFKSSVARWAIAGAGVYYFSTHDIFSQTGIPRPSLEASSETHDTIDTLIAARRERKDAAARGALLADAPAASPATSPASHDDAAAATEASGDPAALEEEAEGEGAFNPETGEINWDCSCLGGMAHGPCGPEFREAFSCFVYSTDEPKGIECVPKFKNMQDCFRAHPDIYGAELTDDPTDEELAEGAAAAEAEAASRGPAPASPSPSSEADAPYSGATRNPNIPDRGMTATPASSPRRVGGATGYETNGPGSEERKDKAGEAPSNERKAGIERSRAARAQVSSDHGAENIEGELVPKAAHDAHDAQAANVGK